MRATVVLIACSTLACGRGEGLVLERTDDAALAMPRGQTVVAGGDATCALRADGSLWCWGENSDGALTTPATDLFEPTRIGTDGDWTEVSGAHGHCALKAGGALFGWGPGRAVPTLTTNAPLTAIEPTLSFTRVFSGEHHHCALATDASLRCWGDAGDGELGLGDTASRTSPTILSGAWREASLGRAHTCVIGIDGALSCFGTNEQGQLGVGDRLDRHVPTRVGTRSDWASVSAGGNHTCALATDGALSCWGENAYGEVGAGDVVVHDQPVRIGTATWLAVSSGAGATCAIAKDHTLWCFGDFAQAPQPGQGHTPVQVDANRDWERISTGRSHACGVRTGLGVHCFGWNFAGQLSRPKTTTYSAIPILVMP